MTQDGITFVSWFFHEFWRLFNCFYIPGTGMTPAALGLTMIVIPIALRFILRIIGQSSPANIGSVYHTVNEKSKGVK